MFDSLRQWLDDVTQDKRAVFLMGLVAFGAVAIILASGSFNVQFGQLFAADTMECRTSECRAECGGDGYCDGDSCVCGDSSEDTPSATSTEPCVPVSATNWGGFPPSVSAGNNACRAFSNPPVSGFNMPLPQPPENFKVYHEQEYGEFPRGAPYDCFYFDLAVDEWKAYDALTGGKSAKGAGDLKVSGTTFNNCPWPVEIHIGANWCPKSGTNSIYPADGNQTDEGCVGPGSEAVSRGGAAATSPGISSCWNWPHLQSTAAAPAGSTVDTTGGSTVGEEAGGAGNQGNNSEDLRFEPSLIRPLAQMTPYSLFRLLFGSHAYAQTSPYQQGCQGTFEATIKASAFNAGRMEVAVIWRHHNEVGKRPGGDYDQDAYGVLMNYGNDYTGAPGQNGPSGAGGGSAGTGVYDDAGWCGEWTDAIWAQRHAAAAHNCNPGYVITQELADYFFDTYGRRPPAGSIGKNDGFFLDWSNGEVQAFIDVMDTNYAGGNQGCVPNSGVDYDAIEAAYEDISTYGFGLSDNGTSLIAKQCKDPSVEPATLEASCPSGEPPVQLTWSIPVGAVANSILKRNITAGTDSQFMTGISSDTTFLEDSDVEDGTTYSYAHKAHASVISESVEVTIDDDGTCGIQVIEPVCGDGTCQDSETCNSCEQDCGTCGAGADCGDGVCQLSETCSTCEEDCNACPTESPGVVTVTITPTPQTGATGTGGTGGTNGQVGTAGTVPTGPGEATVVALLLSALTALLYVSYTHTNVFKEREAKHLGEEQDPMDFRQ